MVPIGIGSYHSLCHQPQDIVPPVAFMMLALTWNVSCSDLFAGTASVTVAFAVVFPLESRVRFNSLTALATTTEGLPGVGAKPFVTASTVNEAIVIGPR